jgi:type IV pilus assembly protein PilM
MKGSLGQKANGILGKFLPDLSNWSGALASLTGGGSAVGLSIGSSSVKLAELKRSGKAWKLLNWAVNPVLDESIVNREIHNAVAVTESLRTLLSGVKLQNKSVCTALSGATVTLRRMMVEVANPKEIQEQVFWEAEQYVNEAVADVVMDFHQISRSKDGKTDVILVAAKRSVLDSYTACVEDAGLKAKVVDLDFLALQTVFEANYQEKPGEAVALVDIGSSSLKLVVVFGGVPVYTKDAAIGGRNLTLEIQKQLESSFADAEALKTEGPIPQPVSELMHAQSGIFAQEIKRAIDFHGASSSSGRVTSLFITGGSSRIPGLAQVLEAETQLPVQELNPFNAIQVDPAVYSPEYLAKIAPLAAIPVGLAIRAGTP